MQYFYQGVWIFIGIVAGITVNFCTQKVISWRNEKNILKNFKFEIEYNIKKIEKFIEYLRDFRDCINGDVLNNFVKYFDLSRLVFNTTNGMLYNGLLYKYLSNEDVENVLVIISQFTLVWENQINNAISQQKNNFNLDRESDNQANIIDGLSTGTISANQLVRYYSKEEAISLVVFWDNFFKKHRRDLQKIKTNLKI